MSLAQVPLQNDLGLSALMLLSDALNRCLLKQIELLEVLRDNQRVLLRR